MGKERVLVEARRAGASDCRYWAVQLPGSPRPQVVDRKHVRPWVDLDALGTAFEEAGVVFSAEGITCLRKRADRREAEAERLRERAENLAGALEGALNQRDEMRLLVQKLNEDVYQGIVENRQLRARAEKVEERADRLQKEHHELCATPFADRARENVALKENQAGLEAECDRLRERAEKAEATNREIEAALNEKGVEIDEYRALRYRIERLVHQARENDRLRAQIAALTEERDRLRERLRDSDALSIDILQEQIAALTEERDRLREECELHCKLGDHYTDGPQLRTRDLHAFTARLTALRAAREAPDEQQEDALEAAKETCCRAGYMVTLDDPCVSAYYNARTCVCGEDASEHVVRHPSGVGLRCTGFDNGMGIGDCDSCGGADDVAVDETVIHEDSSTRQRHHCCYPGCGRPAEFSIYGEPAHPDDWTESCEEHVGALLGTPAWREKDDEAWTVVPIKDEQPEDTPPFGQPYAHAPTARQWPSAANPLIEILADMHDSADEETCLHDGGDGSCFACRAFEALAGMVDGMDAWPEDAPTLGGGESRVASREGQAGGAVAQGADGQ